MTIPYLEKSIDKLNVDTDILLILCNNNIQFIKQIWLLKRDDLKQMNLTDNQINQIVIKLQLNGVDLNKKVYNKF